MIKITFEPEIILTGSDAQNFMKIKKLWSNWGDSLLSRPSHDNDRVYDFENLLDAVFHDDERKND